MLKPLESLELPAEKKCLRSCVTADRSEGHGLAFTGGLLGDACIALVETAAYSKGPLSILVHRFFQQQESHDGEVQHSYR